MGSKIGWVEMALSQGMPGMGSGMLEGETGGKAGLGMESDSFKVSAVSLSLTKASNNVFDG